MVCWLILCVNLAGPPMSRCLDKYSGCVYEGLWTKLTSQLVKINKADCPPYCGWASPNQLNVWIEQKKLTLLSVKGKSSCLTAWPEPLSSCLQTQTETSALLGLKPASFWMGTISFIIVWIFFNEGKKPKTPGLQLPNYTSGEFSASIITWVNSL